ncbi:transcription termination factor MTEF1, chloroplastic-like [Aristolochia californica]|uniref:transcription termination factor MTEF1, chloroplastic-like n=1 Tax=Aristolochia californica TaxID=171875 RepID=UPI0035DBCE0C
MRPKFLLCDVERTLRPKIEFFNEVGFTGTGLVELILRCPDVLRRSVEEHLGPAIKLLRIYLGSDENIEIALRRCHVLLAANDLKSIIPKFELLRGYGVPDQQIVKLFLKNPRFFMHKTLLERNITRLENFRVKFSPGTLIHAISTIATMTATTFEAKCKFLKRYGWSEEHIASAFQKTPYFLMASVDVSPKMFGLSLEKRLRPRTQVLQILRSSGLLKKDVNWSTVMLLSDYTFFRRYVLPFKGRSPELEKFTGFEYSTGNGK